MNIRDSTSDYEQWLGKMTDVQESAIVRKHNEMGKGPFPLLRATFYRWVRHWKVRCPELDSRDQDVLLSAAASSWLQRLVSSPPIYFANNGQESARECK